MEAEGNVLAVEVDVDVDVRGAVAFGDVDVVVETKLISILKRKPRRITQMFRYL